MERFPKLGECQDRIRERRYETTSDDFSVRQQGARIMGTFIGNHGLSEVLEMVASACAMRAARLQTKRYENDEADDPDRMREAVAWEGAGQEILDCCYDLPTVVANMKGGG